MSSAPTTLKYIGAETTPSSATTAAGGSIGGCNGFDAMAAVVEFTAPVGGMGGTLDLYLQSSWDGGTTWWDLVHLAQFASGAASSRAKVSPGFNNTITTIGKNLTPALTANACAGGHWGDTIRTLYVSGSGTTTGATVKVYIHGINTRGDY